MLSVLGRADKSWHAVMKRLHELPVTAVRDEHLRTVVGSDDQAIFDAYQDELFRVLEQRTSGEPRAVLIKLGVARSFDTLKKWLQEGFDLSLIHI